MVAKMKPMPTDDKLFGKRRVDGSVIHPFWSPDGSKRQMELPPGTRHAAQ
jgi:hypothetical protein